LPELPRGDAGLIAKVFQEPIECLLESASGSLERKHQELPHPSHQVRLLAHRGDVALVQEFGVSFEGRPEGLDSRRHNQLTYDS